MIFHQKNSIALHFLIFLCFSTLVIFEVCWFSIPPLLISKVPVPMLAKHCHICHSVGNNSRLCFVKGKNRKCFGVLLFDLLLFKYVIDSCSKIYQLRKGWEISNISMIKHNFCSDLKFWLKLHKIKAHSYIYHIIHELCGHLWLYFFLCLFF